MKKKILKRTLGLIIAGGMVLALLTATSPAQAHIDPPGAFLSMTSLK